MKIESLIPNWALHIVDIFGMQTIFHFAELATYVLSVQSGALQFDIQWKMNQRLATKITIKVDARDIHQEDCQFIS